MPTCPARIDWTMLACFAAGWFGSDDCLYGAVTSHVLWLQDPASRDGINFFFSQIWMSSSISYPLRKISGSDLETTDFKRSLHIQCKLSDRIKMKNFYLNVKYWKNHEYLLYLYLHFPKLSGFYSLEVSGLLTLSCWNVYLQRSKDPLFRPNVTFFANMISMKYF